MSNPGGTERWMDLADAITLLREQIAEAQKRIAEPGTDQGVRFAVQEITVELGMELTEGKGVNGGLRWSVVSAGGHRDHGSKATHTVTVKVAPHGPGDRPIEIVGTD
ncbi:trypco2 family protein [Embleya sp. NPDC001921]